MNNKLTRYFVLACCGIFCFLSSFAAEIVLEVVVPAEGGLIAVPNGHTFTRAYAVDSEGGTVPVEVGEPTTMNHVTLIPVVVDLSASPSTSTSSLNLTVVFTDNGPLFTGRPAKVMREAIKEKVLNPDDVPTTQYVAPTRSRLKLAVSPLSEGGQSPDEPSAQKIDGADVLILSPHDNVALWQQYATFRKSTAAGAALTFKVVDLDTLYYVGENKNKTWNPVATDGTPRNPAEVIHMYLRDNCDKLGVSYVILGGSWIDAQSIDADGYWLNSSNQKLMFPTGAYMTLENCVPGVIAHSKQDAASDMFYACLDLSTGQIYPWCVGDSTEYFKVQDKVEMPNYDRGVDVIVSRLPLKPVRIGDKDWTSTELMDAFIEKLRRVEGTATEHNFIGTGRLGNLWHNLADPYGAGIPVDASLPHEHEFYDDVLNLFDANRDKLYNNGETPSRKMLREHVSKYYPIKEVDSVSPRAWTKGYATSDEAKVAYFAKDRDFGSMESHGYAYFAGSEGFISTSSFYAATGITLLNDFTMLCATGQQNYIGESWQGYTHSVPCLGEAAVDAPFGGAIASLNNSRDGLVGGENTLSYRIYHEGARKFLHQGGNAGETWLESHIVYAKSLGSAGDPGGNLVLVEHTLFGDPLVKSQAFADKDKAFESASYSVSGVEAYVDATASGDLTLSGSGRLKVLQTLSIGGTSFTVADGVEGGVGQKVVFTGAEKGAITINTTKRFYLGGVENCSAVVVNGSNVIVDCDNLGEGLSSITFNMTPDATCTLRGLKKGALADINLVVNGGKLVFETSDVLGQNRVDLNGATLIAKVDPALGANIPSMESMNGVFYGSGKLVCQRGTEALKKWSLQSSSIVIESFGELEPAFEYFGVVGSVPSGWINAWKGEDFDNNKAVLAPNGFVRYVENGHCPYADLPGKTMFTLSLYADLSSVKTKDNAILLSLGTCHNYNQILLNYRSNKIYLDVVDTAGNVLSTANLDYPGNGYHLYTICRAEDKLTLSIDESAAELSEVKFTLGTGIQIGSQFGKNNGGCVRALGMAVAALRGYDVVIDSAEMAALVCEFPAADYPLYITKTISFAQSNEAAATLASADFAAGTSLKVARGHIELPAGTTVDVPTLEFADGSSADDNAVVAIKGTLKVGEIVFNGRGSQTLDLNGGTLVATKDWKSSLPITVSAASIIDSNGHDLILSGSISGSGNLTITGAGSVTILSDISNFSGKITVASSVAKFGVRKEYVESRHKIVFETRPATLIVALSSEQLQEAYTASGYAGYMNAGSTIVFTDYDGYVYQETEGTTSFAAWSPKTYTYDGIDWSYIFLPYERGVWEPLINWRTIWTNGKDENAARLFTSGPAPQLANSNRWYPIILNGEEFQSDDDLVDGLHFVRATRLEGWNPRIGVYNGVHLYIDEFFKFQHGKESDGVTDADKWLRIDDKSRITIAKVGTGNSSDTMKFYVGGENALVFKTNVAGNTSEYYLSEGGSVKFESGVSAGTHTVKEVHATLGNSTGSYYDLKGVQVASFNNKGSSARFTSENGALKLSGFDGVTRYKANTLEVLRDAKNNGLGGFTLMQGDAGVYAMHAEKSDSAPTEITVNGPQTGLDLTSLPYDTITKVKITGAWGYFKGENHRISTQVEFNDTAAGLPAFRWENGYSTTYIAFANATGHGTIFINGGTKTSQTMFFEGGDFDGSIVLTNGYNRVIFGEAEPVVLAEASKIAVKSGTAANLKDGGVWAASELAINGTLNCKGAADVICFGGITGVDNIHPAKGYVKSVMKIGDNVARVWVRREGELPQAEGPLNFQSGAVTIPSFDMGENLLKVTSGTVTLAEDAVVVAPRLEVMSGASFVAASKIGDTYYGSFAKAAQVAQNGDVIELLADASYVMSIGQVLRVRLNGHTLTYEESEKQYTVDIEGDITEIRCSTQVYTITYHIKYPAFGFDTVELEPASFVLEELPLTLPKPTEENAVFHGWYWSEDFSAEPIDVMPENFPRIELHLYGYFNTAVATVNGKPFDNWADAFAEQDRTHYEIQVVGAPQLPEGYMSVQGRLAKIVATLDNGETKTDYSSFADVLAAARETENAVIILKANASGSISLSDVEILRVKHDGFTLSVLNANPESHNLVSSLDSTTGITTYTSSIKTFTVTIPELDEGVSIYSVSGATRVDGIYTAEYGSNVTITYAIAENYIVSGSTSVAYENVTENKTATAPMAKLAAAKIGNTLYATIEDAIDHASDGEIILVDSNVTIPDTHKIVGDKVVAKAYYTITMNKVNCSTTSVPERVREDQNTISFRVSVAEGYEISSVRVGETELVKDEDSYYRYSGFTSDITVDVITALKQYMVTIPSITNASAFVGGAEVGDSCTVAHGGSITVEYRAVVGYFIKSGEATKTLTDITANATLNVSDIIIAKTAATVNGVPYETVAEAIANAGNNEIVLVDNQASIPETHKIVDGKLVAKVYYDVVVDATDDAVASIDGLPAENRIREDQSFTIVVNLNDGYRLASSLGVTHATPVRWSGNPYQLKIIDPTGTVTITVNATRKTFTVKVPVGDGRNVSISPEGAVDIPGGKSIVADYSDTVSVTYSVAENYIHKSGDLVQRFTYSDSDQSATLPTVVKAKAKIGGALYETLDAAIVALGKGQNVTAITLIDKTITSLPVGHEDYKIVDGVIVAKTYYQMSYELGEGVLLDNAPTSIREDVYADINYSLSDAYELNSIIAEKATIDTFSGHAKFRIKNPTGNVVVTITTHKKTYTVTINGLGDGISATINGADYTSPISVNHGDSVSIAYSVEGAFVLSKTSDSIASVTADIEIDAPTKAAAVAQVGLTYYATLKDAVESGAAEIDIIANIGSENVVLTKNLTLNVGGNYTFAAVLSGDYSLTKTGTGTLSISAAQTLTGDFIVAEGKVEASEAVRAKNADAYVEVRSGANLTFTTGVQVDSGYKFKLAGSGLSDEGALVMSAAGNWRNNMQITSIELTDDATVGLTIPANSGGTGFIASQHGASSLILNGHTFTKKGAQPFFFCNTTVSDSQNTGKIVVAEGAIELVNTASAIQVPVEGKLDIQAPLTHTVNNGKSTEYEATVNAKLTKAGAGTLTLKNTSTLGSNAKFAMYNNSSGTLKMTDNFSVTCGGAIAIESGKTLDLDVGSWLKVVGGLKGAGTLNLSGSATVSLNSDNDGIVVDGTTVNTSGNLSLRGLGNQTDDSGTNGACILKNATINITGGTVGRRGVVKIDGDTSITKTGGTVGDTSGDTRFEFDAAELLDGATLKVSGLDSFNVTTQVPCKHVVGNGTEASPYSLAITTYTVTLGEHAHAAVLGLPETSVREDADPISFTVTPDDDFEVTVVKANETVLTEVDGVYSHKVTSATTITVETARIITNEMTASKLNTKGAFYVNADATLTVDADITGNPSIVNEGSSPVTVTLKPSGDKRYVSAADVHKLQLGENVSLAYDWQPGKIISINFDSGRGEMFGDDVDMTFAGKVPRSSWVNTTGGTGTNVAVGRLWDSDAGETQTISGMTISYRSNGTWYPSSATLPFMKGYLDISNHDGGTHEVEIDLAGIPFKKYDLIVYYQGDGSSGFRPVKVTHNFGATTETYGYDSNYDVVKTGYTDPWGQGNQAEISYEKNTMRVNGLVGSVLKIGPLERSSVRPSVAAIQIVENTEGIVTYRRNPAAASNDWMVENGWLLPDGTPVTWTNPDLASGQIYTAEIDADQVSEIKLTSQVSASSVIVMSTTEREFKFLTDEDLGHVATPDANPKSILNAPVDATGFKGALYLQSRISGAISMGTQMHITFVAMDEGVETTAYPYEFVGNLSTITKIGPGTFRVPQSMAAAPYNIEEGYILYDYEGDDTVQLGKVTGNGTAILKTSNLQLAADNTATLDWQSDYLKVTGNLFANNAGKTLNIPADKTVEVIDITDQANARDNVYKGTGILVFGGNGSGYHLLNANSLPATSLTMQLENSKGLIIPGDGITLSNISGSKGFRSDYDSTKLSRPVKFVQSKNTVWAGNFVCGNNPDRIGTVTVSGADNATEKMLTLAGDYSSVDNALVVDASGSVKLTGTWNGNVTVNGEFGGSGTIKNATVTFADGATLNADFGVITLGDSTTLTLPETCNIVGANLTQGTVVMRGIPEGTTLPATILLNGKPNGKLVRLSGGDLKVYDFSSVDEKSMIYYFPLDGDTANRGALGDYGVSIVGTPTITESGALASAKCFKANQGSVVASLPNGGLLCENGFTVSFWVNPNNLSSWEDACGFQIGDMLYKFEKNGGSQFAMYSISASEPRTSNDSQTLDFTANTWMHIALVPTTDGTGLDTYVNGAFVRKYVPGANKTLYGTAEGAVNALTKFVIGVEGIGSYAGTTWYGPNGRTSSALVDEVAIFNTNLNPVQIAYLAENRPSAEVFAHTEPTPLGTKVIGLNETDSCIWGLVPATKTVTSKIGDRYDQVVVTVLIDLPTISSDMRILAISEGNAEGTSQVTADLWWDGTKLFLGWDGSTKKNGSGDSICLISPGLHLISYKLVWRDSTSSPKGVELFVDGSTTAKAANTGIVWTGHKPTGTFTYQGDIKSITLDFSSSNGVSGLNALPKFTQGDKPVTNLTTISEILEMTGKSIGDKELSGETVAADVTMGSFVETGAADTIGITVGTSLDLPNGEVSILVEDPNNKGKFVDLSTIDPLVGPTADPTLHDARNQLVVPISSLLNGAKSRLFKIQAKPKNK